MNGPMIANVAGYFGSLKYRLSLTLASPPHLDIPGRALIPAIFLVAGV